jgi:hypothetical protein
VIVAIVALAAGGCAARSKAPVLPVALDEPAPPPRIIVPPEPETPELPAPAPEPDAAAPKTARRPPVAAPARTTDLKLESPRPVQAAQPAPPAGSLQLALPTSPAELARHVREQIGEAQADLARVDYTGLSADGKSQYDTAKRFIEQAEQALNEKNLVFAAKVAEKAAGLAASLAGRGHSS